MRCWYNDNDRFSANWLESLIADGLILPGVVDRRSIEDVQPSDVATFTRCHFFAGIGGWDVALQLAGWPDDEPVWTASLPCQPFSDAGKRRAEDDERHLWPTFQRLVAECRPPTIFGEQVASRLGREWLAGIRIDLEGMGYAVGAADLSAACVAAPHRRQRLFWLADAECDGRRLDESGRRPQRRDADRRDREGAGGLGDAAAGRLEIAPERDGQSDKGPAYRRASETGVDGSNFWSDSLAIPCDDGKARRVPAESALFPLAPRLPGRVGILRGAGSSIIPQVAAAFVRAARGNCG